MAICRFKTAKRRQRLFACISSRGANRKRASSNSLLRAIDVGNTATGRSRRYCKFPTLNLKYFWIFLQNCIFLQFLENSHRHVLYMRVILLWSRFDLLVMAIFNELVKNYWRQKIANFLAVLGKQHRQVGVLRDAPQRAWDDNANLRLVARMAALFVAHSRRSSWLLYL